MTLYQRTRTKLHRLICGRANGGGESDTPQRCYGCGVFLENPLHTYIYQAALWCESCTDDIKEQIAWEGVSRTLDRKDSNQYPHGPYAGCCECLGHPSTPHCIVSTADGDITHRIRSK